jgi:hypothetical protein
MKNIVKFLSQENYNTAKDVGGAGPNNRSRTIPSKSDKNNDPKRQRKNFKKDYRFYND